MVELLSVFVAFTVAKLVAAGGYYATRRWRAGQQVDGGRGGEELDSAATVRDGASATHEAVRRGRTLCAARRTATSAARNGDGATEDLEVDVVGEVAATRKPSDRLAGSDVGIDYDAATNPTTHADTGKRALASSGC